MLDWTKISNRKRVDEKTAYRSTSDQFDRVEIECVKFSGTLCALSFVGLSVTRAS